MNWYSVRCIFRGLEPHTYEERVTIWMAHSFDEAIQNAEREAAVYVASNGFEYLGLAQGFKLSEKPANGAEVFSLIRSSHLNPQDYVTAFFDTGTEFQRDVKDKLSNRRD
jgi:hypothetical protein